uniref:Uncharacterized protein n=1 Tax=Pararge aegeria TaxID=116150 RepID=S4PX22_9NEOP
MYNIILAARLWSLGLKRWQWRAYRVCTNRSDDIKRKKSPVAIVKDLLVRGVKYKICIYIFDRVKVNYGIFYIVLKRAI